MTKGRGVLIWRLIAVLVLVYVCRALTSNYLHPHITNDHRLIADGILLGGAVCIVLLCLVGKELYDMITASKIMEQGFEIEALVVGNTKKWFRYTPTVVYLLSGIKVQATAMNRCRKPLPPGTISTAKAWRFDSKRVVLVEHDCRSNKQIACCIALCAILLALLGASINVLI